MPYADWGPKPRKKIGAFGLDAGLPDAIRGVQETLRKFAIEVMRPIGAELDRMRPEEVIAPGSPYWRFRKQFLEFGLTVEALNAMPPAEAGLLFGIAFEELGYGDSGLAISAGASMLPRYIAARMGNESVLRRIPEDMLGCWGITEPDHGSDTLDPNKQVYHANGVYGRSNCVARITDGKVILNGQKSAWVSNGVIAEVCILYCAADAGNGPDPHRGVCVVVPLHLDGVTRGKPLDKLGQRALNQGEIFFDNVAVDIDYLLADPDSYARAVYLIHSEANSLMGATFTGCARSAYDLAHAYAHERRQGGVPIIRHQDVARRIFHMFRKVEASCAISRRVIQYNFLNDPPALQAGMVAKVTATQTAFEVASEALQIFGGNGVTREYPIEKILRDARASMIEDGCNEFLSVKGGMYLQDDDLLEEAGK